MPDLAGSADLLARSSRPHLVGVAGAAMRSMASLLLALGKTVSGSDSGSAREVELLARQGVRTAHGHDAANLDGADLVIASAAIPAENPELVAARERGIPILSHAQALGALMASRDGIGVAGTHGKSTTTALVAHLLAVAGRDPTLAGGAHALDFDGYARLGHGPELVAEADEFGRRFLELHPRLAVITAVEPDHLDYYGTFEAVKEAFQQFVVGMAPDGVVVTCEDEPNLAGLSLARRRIRYGWAGHADWRLERFAPIQGGGARFAVRRPDGSTAEYRTLLTGRHNVENAVAALAIAREIGVSDEAAREGLASFQGTRRRFETLARQDGVWVVDDYAHHPTAVAANLDAARNVHGGRLVSVFQPHTTHRTRALIDEFAASFRPADRVIVTPIYQPTGRSNGAPEITSSELVARIEGTDAVAATSLDGAYALAAEELRPGTLVVVFGAGDVSSVAARLAERVREGRSGGRAVAATAARTAP
jgi:UDP-N-acetylmuramate--alanine ligase